MYGGSSLSWDGWCRDRNRSLVRASFDWLECDGIVQVKIPRAAVTKIKQHPLDAKEKRIQMKKVERDYVRGTGTA